MTPGWKKMKREREKKGKKSQGKKFYRTKHHPPIPITWKVYFYKTIVNQIWADFLSNASRLSQLAEVVEKWCQFSDGDLQKWKWGNCICARRPCSPQQVHITSPHVENHSMEVFQWYASKHSDRNLMNDATRVAVQNKFSTCASATTLLSVVSKLLSAWVSGFPFRWDQFFVCWSSIHHDTKTIGLIYFLIVRWASTRPALWWNSELHQVADIQKCGHLPSEAWARNTFMVRRHRRGYKTFTSRTTVTVAY